MIADRTACKFAVRTPLRVHCSRHSAVSAHVSAVAPNGTVPTRGPTNAVTCVLGLRCASFFVVRFMAKRCILEQKCQSVISICIWINQYDGHAWNCSDLFISTFSYYILYNDVWRLEHLLFKLVQLFGNSYVTPMSVMTSFPHVPAEPLI